MPQAKEQATETKERSEETKPRREKGTGTLWKKENGTWMGRVDIGRNAEGKRKYKNFSGKTEAEVKRKIREFNKSAKLYRMELPHRAISVYIYLADRAGKKDSCWPSIPTIAKDLKLSESTTRRALNDLRKAGLVETEQRYRENGGNSSLLFLLKL